METVSKNDLRIVNGALRGQIAELKIRVAALSGELTAADHAGANALVALEKTELEKRQLRAALVDLLGFWRYHAEQMGPQKEYCRGRFQHADGRYFDCPPCAALAAIEATKEEVLRP